jgi:hypothetical protein
MWNGWWEKWRENVREKERETERLRQERVPGYFGQFVIGEVNAYKRAVERERVEDDVDNGIRLLGVERASQSQFPKVVKGIEKWRQSPCWFYLSRNKECGSEGRVTQSHLESLIGRLDVELQDSERGRAAVVFQSLQPQREIRRLALAAWNTEERIQRIEHLKPREWGNEEEDRDTQIETKTETRQREREREQTAGAMVPARVRCAVGGGGWGGWGEATEDVVEVDRLRTRSTWRDGEEGEREGLSFPSRWPRRVSRGPRSDAKLSFPTKSCDKLRSVRRRRSIFSFGENILRSLGLSLFIDDATIFFWTEINHNRPNKPCDTDESVGFNWEDCEKDDEVDDDEAVVTVDEDDANVCDVEESADESKFTPREDNNWTQSEVMSSKLLGGFVGCDGAGLPSESSCSLPPTTPSPPSLLSPLAATNSSLPSPTPLTLPSSLFSSLFGSLWSFE